MRGGEWGGEWARYEMGVGWSGTASARLLHVSRAASAAPMQEHKIKE